MAEPQPGPRPWTLCIDVGGTKIKAMRCDANARPLDEDRIRDTPGRSEPETVLASIEELAADLGAFDRISIGFPAVVKAGVTNPAANLAGGWGGYPLAATLERRLYKPVRAANDADVQGLGAVAGQGIELVLTLGTGVGSALFLDGRLIPNLELGHMCYRDSVSFEQELGRDAFRNVGVREWRRRVPPVIGVFERAFNYDRLYIGGGRAALLRQADLPSNVVLVRNEAGLTGGVALWDGIPKGRTVPGLGGPT